MIRCQDCGKMLTKIKGGSPQTGRKGKRPSYCKECRYKRLSKTLKNKEVRK